METAIDIQEPASSVAALLHEATRALSAVGVDSPRLNAEVLLAKAAGLSRAGLMARLQQSLPPAVPAAFDALLRRRMAREPLQYVVGVTEFWSLELEVTADVLIPRPETERLVELVLDTVRGDPRWTRSDDSGGPTICDLGTGSGCIAIALAYELRGARVTAVDASTTALRVAEANVARHQLTERVALIAGDLFAALPNARFDIIVSNPPYVAISERSRVQPELRYEPDVALYAERDGLEVIERILRDAPEHLSDGGWLFMEIGSDQKIQVEELARRSGARLADVVADYAGLPRVLRARW